MVSTWKQQGTAQVTGPGMAQWSPLVPHHMGPPVALHLACMVLDPTYMAIGKTAKSTCWAHRVKIRRDAVKIRGDVTQAIRGIQMDCQTCPRQAIRGIQMDCQTCLECIVTRHKKLPKGCWSLAPMLPPQACLGHLDPPPCQGVLSPSRLSLGIVEFREDSQCGSSSSAPALSPGKHPLRERHRRLEQQDREFPNLALSRNPDMGLPLVVLVWNELTRTLADCR